MDTLLLTAGLDASDRAALLEATRCESILALSGGAQNGAFGAGFLHAWHLRGAPRFDVITGVSTGALQAPLIFAGTAEAYASLREGYLSAGIRDLIEMRPIVAVPFSSSLATARGLERFVQRHVSDRIIDQVAAEGAGGRRLYVGTTNLDTGWLTVWDMVCIAVSRDYDRFREILLASSQPPPVFPPVCIDGFMHSDGGVRQQIFVTAVITAAEREHQRRKSVGIAALERSTAANAAGAAKAALAKLASLDVVPRVHFVVNGYLGSRPHCTDVGILAIALRSAELLTDEALIASIWKAHGQLRLTGTACGQERFQLVSMPESALIPGKGSLDYDRADMRRLFEAGERMARLPDPWLREPCRLPNMMHFAGCAAPGVCPPGR